MRLRRLKARLSSPGSQAADGALTGIALGGAFAAGALLSSGRAVSAALVAAFTAGILAARYRRDVRRRAFAGRLVSAALTVGDDAFVRPIAGGDHPALDAVAAAMAKRSDELRQRFAELERVRRGFDALFDALQGPALLLDERGRVRRINPAAAKLFEISPEEAEGRPVLQVIRENSIDDAVNAVLARMQGSTAEVEVVLSRQMARLFVQIEPVAADDGRSLAGIVLLLTDITRLHYLEQVRREFVANLSHELRTPITSIQGFVETLLEDETPPEVQERFLVILKEEAERLDALLRDMLELSLLESDTGPLEREPVDLAALAADTLDALAPQMQKKRITAEQAIPEGLPPVPADRSMLEQVLVNLVDNAVKYSPEGSRIRIEARRVAVDHVELAVADDGPGIPSEHLPRLFERFYRVDKARSRAEGGSGLGLSIVQQIVERHGGSVRAESRLGKGSRFIVTLPLFEEEDAPSPWGGSDASPGGRYAQDYG